MRGDAGLSKIRLARWGERGGGVLGASAGGAYITDLDKIKRKIDGFGLADVNVVGRGSWGDAEGWEVGICCCPFWKRRSDKGTKRRRGTWSGERVEAIAGLGGGGGIRFRTGEVAGRIGLRGSVHGAKSAG